MGGSPLYVRPVPNYGTRWLSSFWAHQNRTTPSKEPGVDYYCPIGTPLVSIGDGKVLAVGGSIFPATGRYIWVGLDSGQSFRFLHLKEWRKKVGDRVRKGEVIAISGASGYGSEFFGASSLVGIPANTGGPHVHATLFPRWTLNFAATLDLELYVDKSTTAASNATAFEPLEEEIMAQREYFFTLHRDNLYLCKLRDSILHLVPGDLDVGMGGLQTKGWWNLSDGAPLFNDIATFNTKGGGTDWNDAAFENIKRLCTLPPVDLSGVGVQVSELLDDFTESLRALGITDIDEAKITEGLASVLPASVAAELAKRLAS